ncbi:ATP-grasp ribosomal peptide maturase [Streptomyces sp. RKAG293]|uniref:ATP-grasp ribosomal peptide maturase n=1 Tax=Streptomyces sp. RKAG293 TaxID=2893403 RepID=UPI0020340940|nr:ATP-grasp ribosomal peptide maturase [Streptomyces sp. RKAG293]MCM2420983.1 ATP-grasp ribosomal peptide maturase [Streptomyces sp. RKAG293]
MTRLDDPTADIVIAELNRREVPVVRLDPGDFPVSVQVNALFGCRNSAGSVRTASRVLDLERVRSVYWRRPSPYRHDASDQVARWSVEQSRYGLGGILGSLRGAHYVNHPWRNQDAEHKPARLAVAARCGLAVPPTLMTNDVDRARRFARDHGPVVYKLLRSTDFVDDDGRANTVWVEEVPPEDIGPGVAQTLHTFQQRVDKLADVRLTIVGDELFAARIDGSSFLDWRRDYDALSYRLVETPGVVEKGVRAFLEAFGLVFGAFDFGLDTDGRWWMYECNPNGQWAWFPEAISARIASAIADQLQRSGESHAC